MFHSQPKETLKRLHLWQETEREQGGMEWMCWFMCEHVCACVCVCMCASFVRAPVSVPEHADTVYLPPHMSGSDHKNAELENLWPVI